MYFEPGPKLHRLIDLLCLPPTYISLAYAAVHHTLAYYLTDLPSRSSLTYRQYLTINLTRLKTQAQRGWCVNYLDPDADRRIPSHFDDQVDVATFTVPPTTVPRISVLTIARAVVDDRQVTSFMLKRKLPDLHNESQDDIDGRLKSPAKPRERVIFFIVGGGYAHGHPLNPHTAFSLSLVTGARVFCVNYRKSLDDASAFPGSLVDCLAGWEYLLSVGFTPNDIMLTGDSAGANACLALTRYLDELSQNGSDWGLPGSLCLHSPWVDMTSSFPSLESNRTLDHLIDLSRVYVPSHTRHIYPSSPYCSPALAEPDHWARLAERDVRVYIMGYGAEGMRDEIRALESRIRKAGVDVTYREIPGGAHSEFVWADREPEWLGWSWPVVKADFEMFWAATETGKVL